VIIRTLYDTILYIFINLFFLVVNKMKKLKDNEYYLIVEDGIELFNDLNKLKASVLSRLDPYLRLKNQKRGVTIIQKHIYRILYRVCTLNC
jgi:hypothetical protein